MIRSCHNIRIERLWRDIRKDCLEAFRLLFEWMQKSGILHMVDLIEKTALFLVYQPRIQASLSEAADAWNSHGLRTEGYRSPTRLYGLSRLLAKRLGYWDKDPGDSLEVASDPLYGIEEADLGPTYATPEEEMAAGVRIHDEARLNEARELLQELDIDLDREDERWGVGVYLEVVAALRRLADDSANSDEE